jgi:hypothetical protein
MLLLGDKTGDLGNALEGNPHGIEEYEVLMENRVCFELSIKDQNDTPVYYYETDCDKKNTYTVAKRSFIHKNKFYIAIMRAWYR